MTEGLPDLSLLHAFVVLCDSASMAKAAHTLGVSQSAVSQSIRVLEQQLGMLLLDRGVRPAVPTVAGKLLYQQSTALLEQARGLVHQVHSAARRAHAHIHLGCVDSFAATVGPSLIKALTGAARQLRMWSGLTPALVQQMQSRELDLVICTEAEQTDPTIRQRWLFAESWVAVFPAGRSVAMPASIRDLHALAAGLPLVRYSQRSIIGQQIERYLQHGGLQAPQRFEFDATDPLLSLVASGMGWALSTPLCLWQARHYLPALTVLPVPALRLSQRHFYLLVRQQQWAGLDQEVIAITRTAMTNDIGPALLRAMPQLPSNVLTLNDN